jgi:hypothetical protein
VVEIVDAFAFDVAGVVAVVVEVEVLSVVDSVPVLFSWLPQEERQAKTTASNGMERKVECFIVVGFKNERIEGGNSKQGVSVYKYTI